MAPRLALLGEAGPFPWDANRSLARGGAVMTEDFGVCLPASCGSSPCLLLIATDMFVIFCHPPLLMVVWFRHEKRPDLRSGCRFHCRIWPAGAPQVPWERKSKNNKIVARVVSDGSSHEKVHVCGYIEDGLRGGVEFICPVLTEPAPEQWAWAMAK